MKNVKSIFDSNEIAMLEQIGVKLSDDRDYTDDELDDIYDEITAYYQCAAFDKQGNPLPIVYEWESIIDTFFDNTRMRNDIEEL